MQPLSPAVSCGNESYNTKSPITTMLSETIGTCVRIPHILAVATIREWRLLEGGDYLKKYGYAELQFLTNLAHMGGLVHPAVTGRKQRGKTVS